MECPTCGEHHPECFNDLLLGMYLNAKHQADSRLSPQGKEALEMVAYAAEELGAVEAYEVAEAVEGLPEREARIIEAFIARLTLIVATRAEVVGL